MQIKTKMNEGELKEKKKKRRKKKKKKMPQLRKSSGDKMAVIKNKQNKIHK